MRIIQYTHIQSLFNVWNKTISIAKVYITLSRKYMLFSGDLYFVEFIYLRSKMIFISMGLAKIVVTGCSNYAQTHDESLPVKISLINFYNINHISNLFL